MKPLRVELRAKNNVLWHAVFDHYPSVAAFCRVWTCRPLDVGHLLNLRRSPWRQDGTLSPLGQQISEATGVLPEALFPRTLYQRLLPGIVVGEYAPEALQALDAAEPRGQLAPAAEEAVLEAERTQVIEATLQTLTPREAYVIRRRYLEDPPPTLAVLGREFSCSRERVRRIEVTALHKLRHPSRRRRLAEVR